jgi:flavin reductase (DIM6/NTAB) family NADH-FMN oxidoreductase RutF
VSLLSRDLINLAASGPVVIAATCDAEGAPELARVWGLTLDTEADEIVICVPSASGQRLLTNLEQNGHIAVNVTSPQNYRSFQAKGRVIAIASASADERDRVSAHHEAFIESVVAIGMPREMSRRLFAVELEECPDLTAVRMKVEVLFDQTPGPGAGARL